MQSKYNLTPYGEGAFILKELDAGEYKYKILGCDYPIKNDETWRFWIEYGFNDGKSNTTKAYLAETEKEEIKKIVTQELKRKK